MKSAALIQLQNQLNNFWKAHQSQCKQSGLERINQGLNQIRQKYMFCSQRIKNTGNHQKILNPNNKKMKISDQVYGQSKENKNGLNFSNSLIECKKRQIDIQDQKDIGSNYQQIAMDKNKNLKEKSPKIASLNQKKQYLYNESSNEQEYNQESENNSQSQSESVGKIYLADSQFDSSLNKCRNEINTPQQSKKKQNMTKNAKNVDNWKKMKRIQKQQPRLEHDLRKKSRSHQKQGNQQSVLSNFQQVSNVDYLYKATKKNKTSNQRVKKKNQLGSDLSSSLLKIQMSQQSQQQEGQQQQTEENQEQSVVEQDKIDSKSSNKKFSIVNLISQLNIIQQQKGKDLIPKEQEQSSEQSQNKQQQSQSQIQSSSLSSQSESYQQSQSQTKKQSRPKNKLNQLKNQTSHQNSANYFNPVSSLDQNQRFCYTIYPNNTTSEPHISFTSQSESFDQKVTKKYYQKSDKKPKKPPSTPQKPQKKKQQDKVLQEQRQFILKLAQQPQEKLQNKNNSRRSTKKNEESKQNQQSSESGSRPESEISLSNNVDSSIIRQMKRDSNSARKQKQSQQQQQEQQVESLSEDELSLQQQEFSEPCQQFDKYLQIQKIGQKIAEVGVMIRNLGKGAARNQLKKQRLKIQNVRLRIEEQIRNKRRNYFQQSVDKSQKLKEKRKRKEKEKQQRIKIARKSSVVPNLLQAFQEQTLGILKTLQRQYKL